MKGNKVDRKVNLNKTDPISTIPVPSSSVNDKEHGKNIGLIRKEEQGDTLLEGVDNNQKHRQFYPDHVDDLSSTLVEINAVKTSFNKKEEQEDTPAQEVSLDKIDAVAQIISVNAENPSAFTRKEEQENTLNFNGFECHIPSTNEYDDGIQFLEDDCSKDPTYVPSTSECSEVCFFVIYLFV